MTEPSLGSRAASGTLWSVFGALLSKGSQTLVLLVLAKLVAPRELGLLAIGAVVVNLALIVQELGISDVLMYEREEMIDKAARTAVTVLLVGSVAATLVAWVSAPYLASALRAPDATGVIRGLTSVLPCYAVASVTTALLKRHLDFRRRIVPDVVPAVVGGVVAIVLALRGWGVSSLVTGQIVQGVLYPAFAWLVGPFVRPGWDGAVAREMWAFGRHVLGSDLVQLALLNVDYLLVARVLGETPLGLYSLAFRICYLPFLNISYVLNGTAFPYYCRLPSRADIGHALVRVTSLNVLLMAPLCAGLALMAPHIALLGTKWLPAVGAVRLLAVYALVLAVAHCGQVALKAAGRPDLSFASKLSHLVTLTVALLLLVHSGITAVAWGQLVAIALVLAGTWVVVRRHLGVSLAMTVRELFPAAVGVGAMAVVVLVLERASSALRDPTSALGLLVTAPLAAAAYAGVIWLLAGRRLLAALRALRAA